VKALRLDPLKSEQAMSCCFPLRLHAPLRDHDQHHISVSISTRSHFASQKVKGQKSYFHPFMMLDIDPDHPAFLRDINPLESHD